jgi:Cu-Zn family superoxide dismutase
MNIALRTCAALLLVASLPLAAAAQPKGKADPHGHGAADHDLPTKAIAVLLPTEGSKEVGGLTPGKHGFHIHEFGDVSSPDGASAGGHYNPDGHMHGGPDSQERHAGDFGNIEANQEGVATVNIDAKDLKLHFVIGRSFVVHAKADDLKSQPSGDAGGRVAVGVIGIAKGDMSAAPAGGAKGAK